jgi:thiol-disulfide isomerase/thioredoxin
MNTTPLRSETMNRSLLFFAIAMLLALAIGCAGAGGNTPISPANDAQNITANANPPSPASDLTSGHSLLGYWDCVIDPENETISFTPLRTTELHFNLIPVLETGSMKIGLDGKPNVVDGVMHVKVKLTHPYPGKLSLSGFDVKGIFISAGTETGFNDPDLKLAGPEETRLVNADGFTRWWNPAEFMNSGMAGFDKGKLGGIISPAQSAVVNGYKLYADNLTADAQISALNTGSRALFSAGATNTRKFAISLKSGLKFNYAVDASWAAPTPNPPVNVPGDFPLQANQPEPYMIQVIETNNTLWFANSEHGGNVGYDVVIHDWQGVTDIGAVKVDCPGLFTQTAASTTTIDPNTISTHFDVTGPALTSNADLDVLFTVEVPGDYQPSMTGVSKSLRAYYRQVSVVADTKPTFNEPPVAIMQATTATDIMINDSVSFDATASYDPDGTIAEYLWDFNGNGIYGEEPFTGDPSTPTYKYDKTGIFQVRCKVRDNGGKSDISDPVQVKCVLDTNTPPTATAEATTPTTINEDETVGFDASASTDIDGTIVDFQWDFNGDGTYGDTFTGPMDKPLATFPDPGTYYVDLRVIDDDGGVDTLDKKIKVIATNVLIDPVAHSQATTTTDINNCGSVTFDGSASTDLDGTVEQYLWDFNGDGTFGDAYDSGTDVNPTKSFTVGTWDVMLKVIDNEGLFNITTDPVTINVTNVEPTADAEASTPTDIYGGQTVTFDASKSTDSDCKDIATYEWDFNGDGTFGDTFESGTAINPTKTFATVGSFNVFLKVVDGDGAEDTTDDAIVVNTANNPPVSCAQVTSTPPYFWNTDINVSGECSTDVDGTIVSWEWDLGADGSYEKTGMTTSYNFDTAGQYLIQLRVTDDQGATSTLATPLTFYVNDDSNMPPEVTKVDRNRTTSQKNNLNEKVSLSVEFTDPIPAGDTHTYLWTCPYGAFDNPASATPVWTPPNQVVKCQITCRVIDAGGLWDEGTCNQWVTQWPVLTNPNTTDGMIMSYPMDTADNGTIDPAQYKFPTAPEPDGNALYINFWATWCGYCVTEMPDLDNLYNMYKDEEYVHLHVDVQETKATVQSWVAGHTFEATHWPLDETGNFFFACNNWNGDSNGIPQHLMFDRDGRCRGSHLGCIAAPYGNGAADIAIYFDEFI